VVLVVLLAGSVAAKPGNGHGKGQGKAKGHSAEARGNSKESKGRGKAVRVAAKCPLEGEAKGQFVSSVAKNKSLTVEEVRAACAEALDEQAAEADGSLDDEIEGHDDSEDELDYDEEEL
jgi:hypothetical protein